MLLEFFAHLRDHRVPVSMRELLDLLQAMEMRFAFADLEQFYFLARLCLVKDEKYFDRFDLAFDSYFSALDRWEAVFEPPATAALLAQILAQSMPQPGRSAVARLIEEYRARQDETRRADKPNLRGNDATSTGNAAGEQNRSADDDDSATPLEGEEWRPDPWEKTGGPDPGDETGDDDGGQDGAGDGDEGDSGEGENGGEGEGSGGDTGTSGDDHPGEGIREQPGAVSHRSAVKVWQLRDFADYDPEVELGTRNMKLALRRLRRFARTSAQLELDLAATIASTARNGGILDIKEMPERHNAVKVLMFLDVGGSMDDHIERCAQLFSAARSEFKYLEYYYFHNFIYESVWRDNDRRSEERVSTLEVLHRFGADYKVIFVGDASMARHEIAETGGSVEHYNSEPGEVWLSRFHERFRRIIWLNPVEMKLWADSYSVQMIGRLLDDRMYHLSPDGIEQAMRHLAR